MSVSNSSREKLANFKCRDSLQSAEYAKRWDRENQIFGMESIKFSKDYFQRENTRAGLPLNSVLSSELYERLASAEIRSCIPYGNELEFSIKAEFRDVTLSPHRCVGVRFKRFTREYYRMKYNTLTTDDNGATVSVVQDGTDGRRALDDDSVCAENVFRLDFINFNNRDLMVSAKTGTEGAVNDRVLEKATSKLRLHHAQYDCAGLLNVTCSVAYESEYSDGKILEIFNRHRASLCAHKTFQFFAYFISVPYGDGMFCKMRIAFRQRSGTPISLVGPVRGSFQLDIECEDPVPLGLFAELATTLVEYFAYQCETNAAAGRVIDEFTCSGNTWLAFKRQHYPSSDDWETRGSAIALDNLRVRDEPYDELYDSYDYTDDGKIAEYENLVQYLGLKTMVRLTPATIGDALKTESFDSFTQFDYDDGERFATVHRPTAIAAIGTEIVSDAYNSGSDDDDDADDADDAAATAAHIPLATR